MLLTSDGSIYRKFQTIDFCPIGRFKIGKSRCNESMKTEYLFHSVQ